MATSITARWTLVSKVASKARSSHAISVTHNGQVLMYGGELLPRTPVDINNAADTGASAVLAGSVHLFDLKSALYARNFGAVDRWSVLRPQSSTYIHAEIPEPRVGATIVWDEATKRLYLWGGRGGVDMAPLPPGQAGFWAGHVNVDAGEIKWAKVNAINEEDAPEPRSYHTAVCSPEGKIYIHAGCPVTGRLSTLHSFDVSSKIWTRLTPAPLPERGGTALALLPKFKGVEGGVILRFGGFAGYELPTSNTLDIYAIASNTWHTVVPSHDPSHGYPGPRSVHGFVPFSSSVPALKNVVALLYHGEKDPSSLGHAGAGEFWDDVWVLVQESPFTVPSSEGETNASSGGLAWRNVRTNGAQPEGRGWFPGGCYVDEDKGGSTKAVLFGGLLRNNERSGEGWVLEVE